MAEDAHDIKMLLREVEVKRNYRYDIAEYPSNNLLTTFILHSSYFLLDFQFAVP